MRNLSQNEAETVAGGRRPGPFPLPIPGWSDELPEPTVHSKKDGLSPPFHGAANPLISRSWTFTATREFPSAVKR